MRALLIAPHWLYVYEQYASLSKAINFHPPLGLCALSAVAERAGHDTRVLDAEGQALSPSDIDAVADEFQPDLVALSVTTPVLDAAALIATRLKSRFPELPIVVGGPHVTLTGAETLEQYPVFDLAITGEGEYTFPKLLDALEQGTDVHEVPGILWRDGSGVHAGRPNLDPVDLDTVPFPDRTKLRLDRYIWSVPGAGLQRMASVQASRGCPLKCVFCSEDRIYPKAIRWKSVSRVLEELEEIRRTTTARHIVFLDDTITLHRRWAMELFTEMRKAGFGFTWEGETTANRVDEELVEAMVGAGLRRINFGIESGDREILAKLGKGVSLDAFRPAYRLMKRFGVETRGSVILGNPYETSKTVRRTLRFIWGLRELDQAYINISAPYPGTVLREMALRGDGGIELLEASYGALRRYGGGVMRVNDLTPKRLARFQKIGTLVFYLHPRRFIYNLRRSGFRAMWRNGKAFLVSLFARNAPVQVASGI